jgi:hypothetical protein
MLIIFGLTGVGLYAAAGRTIPDGKSSCFDLLSRPHTFLDFSHRRTGVCGPFEKGRARGNRGPGMFDAPRRAHPVNKCK